MRHRSLALLLLCLFACGDRSAAGKADASAPPSPVDGGSTASDAGDAAGADASPRVIDAGVAPSDAGPFLTPPDANGFGPSLFDGGATFRVWAPNADAASVVGDFGAEVLTPLGDGTFAGAVAGAHAGQQYHYEIETNGQTFVRTDPRAPLVGANPGGAEPEGYLYDQSSYAWQSSGFFAPPLRQAVIYELHIATFVDPTGKGAGTYASAATKLGDLAELGVNVVELMPVASFPGAYGWGYRPDYPFAPVTEYGPPDDLKSFIDQAHQQGIAVLLDVVFNHFGVFTATAPSCSMWCFDGPCADGGIYFSEEPLTPWGPRPAWGVPEVHDMLVNAITSWVSLYQADGFRWDSVIAIRNTSLDGTGSEILEGARFLRDANLALHARNPNAISVAEDLQGWAAITAPIDAGALNVYDDGYGFDTQWDDGFYYAVEPLLIAASDSARDVTQLTGPLTNGPPMQRVVYTEDHDKVAPQNGSQFQRIPALIGSSQNEYYAKKRSSLGIALVLTTPAVPMLFMGQEFLETLPFPFAAAQALDWTNETTYSGFRTMVHDLIALRKNVAGQTLGLTGDNVEILLATNTLGGNTSPVIAYHRWTNGGAGDDVVVVANFANATIALPVGLPQPGVWHVRFNSDDQTYSSDFGGTPSTDVQANGGPLDGHAQSGTANVGPYSTVILSQ